MTRNENQARGSGAERIAGIALAAVLVCVGVFLAYQFGPRPEAHADEGNTRDQPALAVAPTQAVTPDLLEGYGNTTARVATGRSAVGATEFLDSIERTYVARGFLRASIPTDTQANTVPARRKGDHVRQVHEGRDLYFRSDCPFDIVVGIGRNANPAANAPAENTDFVAYMTIATTLHEGDAAWATYRYDQEALKALGNVGIVDGGGDFPGADPPGIPRIPGSRRVLTVPRLSGPGLIAMYEAHGTPDAVQAWYETEMQRCFWRLDTVQTLEIARTGALIYTQGDRMCTLWIQRSRSNDDRIGIVLAYR